MDSLLKLPEKDRFRLDRLQEENPDVYKFVEQFDRLGYWGLPQLINPNHDLVWMLSVGLASVSVVDEGEQWGVEVELWSVTEGGYVHSWDIRISDMLWLDTLLDSAMDVN